MTSAGSTASIGASTRLPGGAQIAGSDGPNRTIDGVAFPIAWQRGKKLEWQPHPFHGATEFRPRLAIPGDDAVEATKGSRQRRGRPDLGQAEQIETGRTYRPDRVRKTDERQVLL